MTAIEKWNRRWGNSKRADPLWVLTEMRNTRACLADWKISLGPHFPRVRPLLVLCIGQIAASYPSPGSNLRLRVRQREVGYLAHPVGEFDVDAEDLCLSEEDVQMWSLDWAKVEEEFGELVRGKGEVTREQSAGSSGAISQRLREKRVAAGRKRSVVCVPQDRKAIRAEVQRLIDGRLPHAEAYRQVAEQAQHGRAGQRKLTMKYDLPPTVTTVTVVRRVFESYH